MLILAVVMVVSSGVGADAAALRAPSAMLCESPSGTLLILGEKSGDIVRLDPENSKIVAQQPLGARPYALTEHPDGERIYVSCREGQEVVELQRGTLEVLRRFPSRGDPAGLASSRDGRLLYVAMHSLDRVAVLEIETGTEIGRLLVGNGPLCVERRPGSDLIYISHMLPAPAAPGAPPRNELTIVDATRALIVDRVILEGANIARQIAFTGDGRMGIMSISRPKNLVPLVQVARGWAITNGFAVLGSDAEPPLQLLIDQPNRAYADPYAVAWAEEDSKFYITAAGGDAVVAVERERLERLEEEIAAGNWPRPGDHLGLSRRHVVARIPVGANPQSLAVDAERHRVYVGNRLEDSITVIDSRSDRVLRTIALNPMEAPDPFVRGEYLFHSAARTFQQQFSCASCHPDGGFDGLQYDLEPDGIGMDVLDNRSMRGLTGTAPFKWVGTNPDITTQCGTRTAKWITRTGWLALEDVVALSDYIHSIPPVVNPYATGSGRLTPAQRRGKRFFERTTKNDGSPLEEVDQCHFCHSGPQFTNRERFDVGTKGRMDRKSEFDTAHLVNIFESGPYLHDGRALTLEEIWTKYNPDDKHGFSTDWNKMQLNDLVEYLKCLSSPEATP